MKVTYVKIGKNDWKFAYNEGERYGEFYINFSDVDRTFGTAEITYKSRSDAQDLIAGFTEAMQGWADGTLDGVAREKDEEKIKYQKYFNDKFDAVMDKLDDLHDATFAAGRNQV